MKPHQMSTDATRNASPNGSPAFLFGCKRSGTTIAQAMIGSHADVLTFPETNFVAHTFGDHAERVDCQRSSASIPRRIARRGRIAIGLSTRAPRKDMANTLSALQEPASRNPIPSGFVRTDKAITLWAETLNQIAREREHTLWLEKTPMHIGYISEISKILPQARFLHIIRKPEAAVASMVDASRKYHSWRRHSDIGYCVNIWNRAISYSTRYVSDSRHFLFLYENLVSKPLCTMERIFHFLDLVPEEFSVIEKRRKETAKIITSPGEEWKRNASSELKDIDKANLVLSKSQREYVKRNSLPVPELST